MNKQVTIKEIWFIAVGHEWGVMEEICTEKEAEEMRRHKAIWEHAPAIKIKQKDFLKLTNEQMEKNWAYKMILEQVDF